MCYYILSRRSVIREYVIDKIGRESQPVSLHTPRERVSCPVAVGVGVYSPHGDMKKKGGTHSLAVTLQPGKPTTKTETRNENKRIAHELKCGCVGTSIFEMTAWHPAYTQVYFHDLQC